jgi:hypothetical protein
MGWVSIRRTLSAQHLHNLLTPSSEADYTLSSVGIGFIPGYFDTTRKWSGVPNTSGVSFSDFFCATLRPQFEQWWSIW